MPPSKVVSIGAGINLDSFPDRDDNKDYSNGNILFIGIDFPRKGGFELIEAFKVVRNSIPQATLHIVGPHKRIPGVSDLAGVIWHGYLDKNDAADMEKLNSLFLNASLFVMPSLYEPFGIAPLEAMAHEIPCLVSNAWALPEIVPDNICGRLVTPGKWEEMAETLVSLLKSPSTLQKYGKAGREHVENNFTWEKVVGRLKAALMKP
jgi:glycosyltransferase involved in cell wall biosynthesis